MAKAYHFVKGNKLRDGRKVPDDGVELRYDHFVQICHSGLHASFDAFDAHNYAPGNILCLVECKEIQEQHGDKFVCRSRTIIKRFDASEMLSYFQRMIALFYIDDFDIDTTPIVYDYLMTGDEKYRKSAYRQIHRDWCNNLYPSYIYLHLSKACISKKFIAESLKFTHFAHDFFRKMFNDLVKENFSAL